MDDRKRKLKKVEHEPIEIQAETLGIPEDIPRETTITAQVLQDLFRRLRQCRREVKARTKQAGGRRGVLTEKKRNDVLLKTGERCHICGGPIEGGNWHADHVLAHSGGGKNEPDNYLPAHTLCNNYRWDYLALEFQYILKLGVWAKTQIETNTGLGPKLAERFAAYEERRRSRRK